MNPNPNDPSVPFGRVSKFVRLLTHDVRNGLSAIDLQSAFIAELVTDPEVVEEVRKLRNMIGNTAKMLREISLNFQPAALHPMSWEVATFTEELEARVRKLFAGTSGLEVERRVGEEKAQIDLEQLSCAMLQILQNAIQFRENEAEVRVSAFTEGGHLVLEVREKGGRELPVPPEAWGKEPLLSTRQGGFGLGLFRARQIVEGHGGTLESRRVEEGGVATRLAIPLEANS